MARPYRIVFALAPVVVLAAVVVASGGCSSASDDAASTDSADDASTPDAASDTLCTISNPTIGTKCSPTSPCPAPFSCFYYTPGCDSPVGICHLWDVCLWPDAIAETSSRCGCDGAFVDEKTPYEKSTSSSSCDDDAAAD